MGWGALDTYSPDASNPFNLSNPSKAWIPTCPTKRPICLSHLSHISDNRICPIWPTRYKLTNSIEPIDSVPSHQPNMSTYFTLSILSIRSTSPMSRTNDEPVQISPIQFNPIWIFPTCPVLFQYVQLSYRFSPFN